MALAPSVETKLPYTIPADEWGPGYRLWQALMHLLSQRGPDGTTSLVRVASHLVIILVAVLVIGASRVKLPGWDIVETERVISLPQEVSVADAQIRSETASVGSLVRSAVPFTLVLERPATTEIRTYKVQAGDTLYDIAAKFGISAETLMWANSMEENPDLLRLDQELVILPMSGVLHTVVAGETVESIALKYKADPAVMVGLELNHLDPKNPAIGVGAKLVVPGGTKPLIVRARPAAVAATTAKTPADATKGKGRFAWPASGSITQGFRPLHPGLDIGARSGAAVRASDAGFVSIAGWSNVGYGNYVVIDHGNGYTTLYAHLSRINVKAGDSVTQGATIGAVGSTGWSTGPHLHFELRLNGIARNPYNSLP